MFKIKIKDKFGVLDKTEMNVKGRYKAIGVARKRGRMVGVTATVYDEEGRIIAVEGGS